MFGIPLIILGCVLIGFSVFARKVPKNNALIAGDTVHLSDGWKFGLFSNDNLVESKKKQKVILLSTQTLDEGVLCLKSTINYAPDTSSADQLRVFQGSDDVVETTLDSRFKDALGSWIKQKPHPGTLRKALTMKLEAQQYCRAYLTQSSTESDSTSLALYSQDSRNAGMPISDLGVVVYEVNIFEMKEEKKGTGIPIWGDEDSMTKVDKLLKDARTSVEAMNLLEQEVEEMKKGASPELQETLDKVIKQQKRDLKRFKD